MKKIFLLFLLVSLFAQAKSADQVYVMPHSGSNIAEFGQVALSATAAVVGILPVVNGGTGGSTTQVARNNLGLAPTLTVITATGSGTYFIPTITPLYIRVRMVGGGGGGASGGASNVVGGDGADTTFGSLLTASHGSKGQPSNIGASGGACTINLPAKGIGIVGASSSGGIATQTTSTLAPIGTSGASSALGGSGGGGAIGAFAGISASISSGSGGGGGGGPTSASGNGGSGGGAGCFIDAIISSPSSSYSYSVGSGGAAGSGGTGGNGGAGGSGMIEVTEYYM